MKSWKDKLLAAFRAKDEAGVKEALDEAPESANASPARQDIHIHVNHASPESISTESTPEASGAVVSDESAVEGEKEVNDSEPSLSDLVERIQALETMVAQLAESRTADADGDTNDEDAAPESVTDAEELTDATQDPTVETEDEQEERNDTKSRDSTIRVAWQSLVHQADLIAPGIKLPTLDRQADARKMRDAMCSLRRKALIQGKAGPHGEQIKDMLQGNKVQGMTCDAVTAIFTAAASVARSLTVTSDRHLTEPVSLAATPTPAALNKLYAEYHARYTKGNK